ncbi:hypothetical protein J5N97_004246 [Dioscorea zingiberensis]|uniref:Glyoxal oxidase N-terminal domain-containing protein n=1 Tax=Dioscorea zingiberensis TaxID=325984 RepID=A0A9D5HQS9_9LILI|nr:hypothetical protein J5N97_004246 [Dioscorea zingiberensis]
MHMQLLPGDQLLPFDCTDFGPSNTSLPGGHCRLDPSDLALTTDCTSHSVLLDLPTLFLRPLTILTDTWCSSSTLLSNASFFKFGGFNDGDHIIHLFTSITPTSDWTETSGYLSARRWYATNQLLPYARKQNHHCRCPCTPPEASSEPDDPPDGSSFSCSATRRLSRRSTKATVISPHLALELLSSAGFSLVSGGVFSTECTCNDSNLSNEKRITYR